MLPENEKELLLSNLPGMAYRCPVTPPWVLEYVSHGVRALTGLEPEELTSGRTSWASIMHPEDLERVAAEVENAVADGRQFTCTYRIFVRDGGQRWVLERGRAVYDASGDAVALVGFTTDLTDQKTIEEELRESQTHYLAAVELNPQIPWTADPSGNILEVGPRWLEYLGEHQTREIGGAWQEALHAEDRSTALNLWQESLTSGRPFDCRYRLRLKDGNFRWVRARAAARRDRDGRIIRWYGTIEDIQEQVELETGLRQSEERYSIAARATGDIIWDWDLDSGVIRRILPRPSMFGYSVSELGHSTSDWWEALLHPDDYDRVVAGVRRVASAGGERWTDEYRLRRADGTYAYILDRGFLVRTDDGASRRMVGAMQDVTDRKAAEHKMEELQRDLVHLSSMSAMGTMATTIAHELNQPLTASANYLVASSRMLQDLEGDAKPDVQFGLKAAEDQIRRAGEIIRRMRDIVAQRSGTRERCSLRSLIAAAKHLLEASHSCQDLDLGTRISADAEWLMVDPVQIEQVLLNLMRNGCEAMANLNTPRLLVSATPTDDGQVEVQVRDYGPGLSDEALEKLFSAFGESTTGGLGVGLSISRTIVEAHGGRIWVENANTGGASFHFTVPRAAEADSL